MDLALPFYQEVHGGHFCSKNLKSVFHDILPSNVFTSLWSGYVTFHQVTLNSVEIINFLLKVKSHMRLETAGDALNKMRLC